MDAKTKWYGLWENVEDVYFGQVINKKSIPPYTRLIIKYNRYYVPNSKRPEFVYCFAKGGSAKAISLESDDEFITELADMGYYDEDGNRLYTYDEVEYAIKGAIKDATEGYTDRIVEDYLEV